MCSYDYDQNSHRLTIHVPEAAVNSILILCRERKLGKATHKILQLFFLFRWLNEQRLVHLDTESLATMIFSKHYERAQKAISVLSEMGLLVKIQSYNTLSHRYFYRYYTRDFNIMGNIGKDNISFFYELTWCAERSVKRKLEIIPPHITNDIAVPISSANSTPVIVEPIDGFVKTFLGWYNELYFQGFFIPAGHFSPKDGRFYHALHHFSKLERADLVTWDGEHVKEAWDAPSAFFVVLGYYLRDIKTFTEGEKAKELRDESEQLLAIALDGRLYSEVQRYHNERAVIKYKRDDIKKYVQSYKNYSRSSLFRKDGRLKGCYWCERVRYIDMYFMEHFPAIRNMLLDYPRRLEEDERQPYKMVKLPDGSYTYEKKYRKVSNLQRDVLPTEFQLISLGLCRDLWERFGIKSVTVHDAIYMKESDAAKKIDIDALLSRRLGLSSVPIEEKALF